MPGPGTCSICLHEQAAEIDRKVVGGVPYQKIAAQYGMSSKAISRHKVNHLSPGVVAVPDSPEISPEAPLLERLEAQLADTRLFLRIAKQRRIPGQGLAAMREMRATLELIARITGELDDRPTTVINLTNSPEWLEIRGVIVDTICPECRLKLADAL
jgi:hypothetical protein